MLTRRTMLLATAAIAVGALPAPLPEIKVAAGGGTPASEWLPKNGLHYRFLDQSGNARHGEWISVPDGTSRTFTLTCPWKFTLDSPPVIEMWRG